MTRVFTEDQFSHGLESWEWIGLGGKTPVFASPFGDVFFRSSDGFWWLDTLEGSLTRPWSSAEALKADLGSPEGQDRYLLAGLAWAAEQRGLVPNSGQVYSFQHPPVLGGGVEIDNVEVSGFVVCLNIAGQLHEQVRDLPPAPRSAASRSRSRKQVGATDAGGRGQGPGVPLTSLVRTSAAAHPSHRMRSPSRLARRINAVRSACASASVSSNVASGRLQCSGWLRMTEKSWSGASGRASAYTSISLASSAHVMISPRKLGCDTERVKSSGEPITTRILPRAEVCRVPGRCPMRRPREMTGLATLRRPRAASVNAGVDQPAERAAVLRGSGPPRPVATACGDPPALHLHPGCRGARPCGLRMFSGSGHDRG